MNFPARDLQDRRPPIALHDRAMDNLRYIRETMERSGSFTHVSGLGGVLMGVIALLAAWLAWNAGSVAEWLTIWLVAASLSLGLSILAMTRKSKSEGVSLLTGPGRKFAWSVTPALAAGAVLTVALVRGGMIDILPGVWLLLYGAAVVTGGSHSVRPVPLMGGAFMAVGVLALFSGPSLGNLWMAVGFGGLHMAFGALIWRRYGG